MQIVAMPKSVLVPQRPGAHWWTASMDGPSQLGPISMPDSVLVPQMPGAHWWTGSQAVENPSVDSLLETQTPWTRTGRAEASRHVVLWAASGCFCEDDIPLAAGAHQECTVSSGVLRLNLSQISAQTRNMFRRSVRDQV